KTARRNKKRRTERLRSQKGSNKTIPRIQTWKTGVKASERFRARSMVSAKTDLSPLKSNMVSVSFD
ncbi:MAG TPA: hypothetical protein VLA34_06705, partial [Candidatus Krumholzibacterium sp.]|nr:hypothetical protein [Candidatus Krumholzibacterium sp.]